MQIKTSYKKTRLQAGFFKKCISKHRKKSVFLNTVGGVCHSER